MKNDLVTMDTEALASELMRKSSFNPDNQHKFSSLKKKKKNPDAQMNHLNVAARSSADGSKRCAERQPLSSVNEQSRLKKKKKTLINHFNLNYSRGNRKILIARGNLWAICVSNCHPFVLGPPTKFLL